MTRLTAISAFALAVVFGPALAQVSPAELDAISIPDKVETAVGTLEFFDGVPTDATVATVYDNLDRMRVSRQCRRRVDVQLPQGPGRCGRRRGEQDRPVRAAAGFPGVRGAIAAIGIVKGQPFAPDARMKTLLTEAATLGDATSRAITYHPRFDGVQIYPDDPKSVWAMAYADRNTSFEADGTMRLDARVLSYFNAGGVTPAMATTSVGEGPDYAVAFLDANGQAFDGSKTYTLHLPRDVPVHEFWAVTLYDTQTRSQLQTGQAFPTIGSQTKGMTANADGSYDLYFAPEAPAGNEGNWLQTVPGKSWFTILRMYGPLEPRIEKTWRPGEIEAVQRRPLPG